MNLLLHETLVSKVLTYWMPKFFDQYSHNRGTEHMDIFNKTAKKTSSLHVSMSSFEGFVCTAYKLLCSARHSIIASSKNFLKYSEDSDMLFHYWDANEVWLEQLMENHIFEHISTWYLWFCLKNSEHKLYLMYHTHLKQEDGLHVMYSLHYGNTLKAMFVCQAWHS